MHTQSIKFIEEPGWLGQRLRRMGAGRRRCPDTLEEWNRVLLKVAKKSASEGVPLASCQCDLLAWFPFSLFLYNEGETLTFGKVNQAAHWQDASGTLEVSACNGCPDTLEEWNRD